MEKRSHKLLSAWVCQQNLLPMASNPCPQQPETSPGIKVAAILAGWL